MTCYGLHTLYDAEHMGSKILIARSNDASLIVGVDKCLPHHAVS